MMRNFSVRLLLLLFPCLVAAAPTVEGLPIGRTVLEQTIHGQVKAPDAGVQYQLMIAFRPDVGEQKKVISWSPVGDYSPTGKFEVALDGVGVYDFHLNGIRTPDGEKILNEYLGQIEVTSDAKLSRAVFYAQNHIRVYSVPVTRYLDMFVDKDENKAIATKQGFADFIRDTFDPEIFPKSVRDLGTDAVFAIHATNAIAALYHYGNVKNPDALGCAIENERGKNVSDFHGLVGSYIGCCYDYAALLAYVLKQKGVETQYLYLPGHVLVEGKINGKTVSLDPTVNMVHIGGIRGVMKGEGYILKFPLVGETQGNKYESQAVPRFRRKLIAWLGLASSDEISTEAPDDLMSRIESIME